jgi:adenine-specific DNA-methyltransferase
MDEVNQVIAASAPQETLVDQPTGKAGRAARQRSLHGGRACSRSKRAWIWTARSAASRASWRPSLRLKDEPANAGAYLEKMIRLLKQDGVRFPNNKTLHFSRLEPLSHTVLHAEGEWGGGMPVPRVAIRDWTCPAGGGALRPAVRADHRPDG